MLQKKNIIIQNLNIRYYQSGNFDKNKAVVFLHGWKSKALHFQKILEKCESFIAVDLPGFGESEIPKNSWTLSDYVNFAEEFIKKLGIGELVLVGHSFGGSIGIKYCLRNDCKKLVLIGSAGVRKRKLKNLVYFILAKIFGLIFSFPLLRSLKQAVRRKFYQSIKSEDYIDAGEMAETYKKIIKEDLTGELAKIKIPTAIIWGEEDEETPVKDGKLMNQLIKNSRLFIIPGAGHYVFFG